jgi:hypothetical protein
MKLCMHEALQVLIVRQLLMLESLGLAILITTCFILLLLSSSALFCPLIACSVVLNDFILSNLSSAMVVVKSLLHCLSGLMLTLCICSNDCLHGWQLVKTYHKCSSRCSSLINNGSS